MTALRRPLLIFLLATLPAAVALAQFQLNPQVNTGIYAGPGPTSVRYAGQYSGANTIFNISSKSADTRGGYATTGVYAANPIINGNSPSTQHLRTIPQPLSSNASSSVRYAGSSPASPQRVNGAINAQVSGQINNPRIDGRVH